MTTPKTMSLLDNTVCEKNRSNKCKAISAKQRPALPVGQPAILACCPKKRRQRRRRVNSTLKSEKNMFSLEQLLAQHFLCRMGAIFIISTLQYSLTIEQFPLSFFVVYIQYVRFEDYVYSRGISTMYVILLHPRVSVYMQYITYIVQYFVNRQPIFVVDLVSQSSIYKKNPQFFGRGWI